MNISELKKRVKDPAVYDKELAAAAIRAMASLPAEGLYKSLAGTDGKIFSVEMQAKLKKIVGFSKDAVLSDIVKAVKEYGAKNRGSYEYGTMLYYLSMLCEGYRLKRSDRKGVKP